MEPVEINAGAWYLRGLRADDRVDDRPALTDLGETDAGYVDRAASGWESDTTYIWAVCEPTTGEMFAEVTLNPASGEIASRARGGYDAAALAATEVVGRFAAGALALTPLIAGTSSGAAPADENPADSAYHGN